MAYRAPASVIPACLAALLPLGCAHMLPPGAPLREKSVAVPLAAGEYFLASGHDVRVGDVFLPAARFAGRNVFKDLAGRCDKDGFMLVPASVEFRKDLNRELAGRLFVGLTLNAEAAVSSVDRAHIDISSSVRTAMDHQGFAECLRKLPDAAQDILLDSYDEGAEIVTQVVSGPYTVRFSSARSASLTSPVAVASGTAAPNSFEKSGDGPSLFYTEPVARTALSLSVRPERVAFEGLQVVKQVEIRGNVATGWRLLPAERSGGFICLPGGGEASPAAPGRLYVVRLPEVRFADERIVMAKGADLGADFRIQAALPKLSPLAYERFQPQEDDPPELSLLVRTLSAYHLGRPKEAAAGFKKLAKLVPSLQREPSFGELRDRNSDILRHSARRGPALERLFCAAARGFGEGAPGVETRSGGCSVPPEAVAAIKDDPALREALLREPLISHAAREDPELQDAFGLAAQE